ncbi:putative hydroxyindole o- protein [Eutypa lata UCREL1]|uniref:Putative hydroxyindole o-protein n=1 Tax=Eutypa lata (strain UCR-EL1) TaxID=1287681 RepID=M7TXG9_EUTLA|nr:putative hydroxyindole o- protein [Eutypa lata UCREL1]
MNLLAWLTPKRYDYNLLPGDNDGKGSSTQTSTAHSFRESLAKTALVCLLDELRHGFYVLHEQVITYSEMIDGHQERDQSHRVERGKQAHSLGHIRHCIDLLRQSLMCNADLTIELKNEELGGVTGFGTEQHITKHYTRVLCKIRMATFDTTSVSELERLAQDIASKTQEFMTVLRRNGCALPSHDPGTPRNDALPLEATTLQSTLMELTTELQTLVQGPRLHVHNQILAHVNLVNLHAIYRFKLPSVVPVEGSISYAELAENVEVSEDVVRRIARYAITKHIFREVDGGDRLAHSATSKMLAESPMMMEWIGMVCEEMWPAATQAVPALVKWPKSQEPQHSGFALAHDLQTHVFDMLVDQPERAARFANAMVYFNSNADLAPHHLCDAFDWESVSQVVDIGGSSGSTAVALATRLPRVSIIIQDQAVLEDQARQSIPPTLADRVSFMAHDFFQEQLVRDADVYHFRWIFHDWPDQYCLKLLRALVPALKPGARVVVSDFVVPDSGTASRYKEGLVRGFDLAMMELFNARERERRDWQRLFGEADSSFSFEGVKTVAGADLAFISATWQP